MVRNGFVSLVLLILEALLKLLLNTLAKNVSVLFHLNKLNGFRKTNDFKKVLIEHLFLCLLFMVSVVDTGGPIEALIEYIGKKRVGSLSSK